MEFCVKSSGWHRRRDLSEMTKDPGGEGGEKARISVSSGTTGGGEPAASSDDPPDKDTLEEDVDFDINYQQNGRVVGLARKNEPLAGRGRRASPIRPVAMIYIERVIISTPRPPLPFIFPFFPLSSLPLIKFRVAVLTLSEKAIRFRHQDYDPDRAQKYKTPH